MKKLISAGLIGLVFSIYSTRVFAQQSYDSAWMKSFQSDSTHLKAIGIGEDKNQSVARWKAITSANAELANNFEVHVSSVAKLINESATLNEQQEVMEVFYSSYKIVSAGIIEGAQRKQTYYELTTEGSHKYYIGMQVSKLNFNSRLVEVMKTQLNDSVTINWDRLTKVLQDE